MNAANLLEVEAITATHDTPATVESSPVVCVPYSRLCKSPLNVRRKPPTGLLGMAESIAAKGILQNLIVHEMKGKRGQESKLGVGAGQRRHGGLDLLYAAGRISDDYPVPVRIVSEGEALSASLIENQEREPMHPADQCDAFSRLVAEGKSVQYVAALFSISERSVHRCLKLASVSPRLLDVFRAGEMTFEQITALALTDDQAAQERLWFDATGPGQLTPHYLRSVITDEEINASTNPLVAFVTLDAYEAAGGYVRRDLFSTQTNAGYLADGELLHRLALDKLVAIAQDVAAEGWSWVETRTKRDYDELRPYGRLAQEAREMSRKEKAGHRAIQKARDAALRALDAYYDSEGSDEDDPRCVELQDVVRAAERAVTEFEANLKSWSGEQKARAGVFVTVDSLGQVKIEKGLLKPQDKAAAKSDGLPGTAEIHVVERQPKPLHSERLCIRLTAHRTAAVQAEVSRRPNVALAILMHRMIPLVFDEQYRFNQPESAAGVQVTCVRDDMQRNANDLDANPAWQELETERSRWAEQLPADASHLLPWLLARPGSDIASLFAFCVAASLNGISSTDGAHAINAISDVIELDMKRYWTPTRASYLDHVPKQRIIDVVSQAVSPEAAAPLANMKKSDAAAAAELRLAGLGWLPEVLTNRATPDSVDYRLPEVVTDREADDDERDAA
jgi:ParB family transcriptional regulator, chromosome partitioning protein